MNILFSTKCKVGNYRLYQNRNKRLIFVYWNINVIETGNLIFKKKFNINFFDLF